MIDDAGWLQVRTGCFESLLSVSCFGPRSEQRRSVPSYIPQKGSTSVLKKMVISIMDFNTEVAKSELREVSVSIVGDKRAGKCFRSQFLFTIG